MEQILREATTELGLKCPACASRVGSVPAAPQKAIICPNCDYPMTWADDCWDACTDKTYPRDFARQWVLWEAGKLGDPTRVYGNDPSAYFRELLAHTCLSEKNLDSMKILEVGYGHGRLLNQLQQHCPTAYGIDLSKPLKSANLRPGSAIFGNLLNIPFMFGQFDLVICRGVIHCTPDPEKSFACLAEQVAPRGMLYVGGLYEPGKGNLILRKIFPRVYDYPEPIQLLMASIFGFGRSVVECLRTRRFNLRSIRDFYAHYKLDIFDIISPHWTAVLTENEVIMWFESRGFLARKVGYGDYVGIRK